MRLKVVLLCVCVCLSLMGTKYMFSKASGNHWWKTVQFCMCSLPVLLFSSAYTDMIEWAVTAVTHLVASHFVTLKKDKREKGTHMKTHHQISKVSNNEQRKNNYFIHLLPASTPLCFFLPPPVKKPWLPAQIRDLNLHSVFTEQHVSFHPQELWEKCSGVWLVCHSFYVIQPASPSLSRWIKMPNCPCCHWNL